MVNHFLDIGIETRLTKSVAASNPCYGNEQFEKNEKFYRFLAAFSNFVSRKF
jgi:hypothetical protein